MPLSVSDHLGVSVEVFDRTGAFDAILDLDSELYIDPFLLRRTSIPELAGAHRRLCNYFADILDLLQRSKYEGDGSWRMAVDRLQLGEARWVCIGVSSEGTSGSGIGPQIAESMARNIKHFLDAGIYDPELFEVLPFIQDGVGRDRLSDWVATVIMPDLLAYSQRVLDELGGSSGDLIWQGKRYRLPKNPYGPGPIVLVPRQVLRHMPTILDWSDKEGVSAKNYEVQVRVNDAVRAKKEASAPKRSNATWKQVAALTGSKKLDLFLKYPELIELLLQTYRLRPAVPYDFDVDPRAALRWYRALTPFIEKRPLSGGAIRPDPNGLREFARQIENEFVYFIEQHIPQNLLYDGAKPKRILVASRIFHGLWAKHHTKLGSPFTAPRSTSSGIEVSLHARGWRGGFRVVIGYLKDPGFHREVKDLLGLSRSQRDGWRLVVIGLDTETGYSRERVALSQLVADHQGDDGWVQHIVVNATYTTFRRQVPAKVKTGPLSLERTVPVQPPAPGRKKEKAAEPKPAPPPRPTYDPLPCLICKDKKAIKVERFTRHVHEVHSTPVPKLLKMFWPAFEVVWLKDTRPKDAPCPVCRKGFAINAWHDHLAAQHPEELIKAVKAYEPPPPAPKAVKQKKKRDSALLLAHARRSNGHGTAAVGPRKPVVNTPKAAAATVVKPTETAKPISAGAAPKYAQRYRKGDLEALAGRLLIDPDPMLAARREGLRRSGASLKAIAMDLVSAHIAHEEERQGPRLSQKEKDGLATWVSILLR